MKRGSRYLCGLFLAASLALAIYLVTRAGVSSIFEKFHLLGWGFTVLVLLAGVRQGIRSIAWQICLNQEACCPSLLRLFGLRLVGDAITDVTPAGPLLGECVKVWACSKYVQLEVSAASVASEGLVYGLAAALFISSGLALLLLEVVVPERLHPLAMSLIAFLPLSVTGLGFAIVKQKQPLATLFDFLTSYISRQPLIERVGHGIRNCETSIHQFFRFRRKAFLLILILEILAHTAGVLEVYLILKATTGHVSIMTSYLVEAANRLMHLLFIVPLGLGVEEGVAGATLKVLGYGLTEGVALAVIRKGRTVIWDAVGLMLATRWSISRSDSQVRARRVYVNHEAIDCQRG